jgi:hypothetical protein
MSRHLFLGGPWDGQVREVDPTPHIVVPTVSGSHLTDDFYCTQHIYDAHRFYLQPPTFQHGPSRSWLVYVRPPLERLRAAIERGESFNDHVLHLLYQHDVPPEIR